MLVKEGIVAGKKVPVHKKKKSKETAGAKPSETAAAVTA
jgi:hypothetical protein